MAAAGAEDVEMATAAPAEDERKETPLYGGAMRAYVPKKFLDVRYVVHGHHLRPARDSP